MNPNQELLTDKVYRISSKLPHKRKNITESFVEKRGMFMAQKKGYDVLRFIEHGNGCYISSVYVEGVILIQWLSERPAVKKQDLFLLLHEIAKQMDLLHRSKGAPVYQYMNPYCMVLTDEKKVLFVDMQAQSSEERLRKMQSRKIRERFLPKEDPFYQNSSVQTDLYGYGRTLQFLLSAVRLEEPLSKREEKKLKNLISRCLTDNRKKQFHSALALRKQLPELKEGEEVKDSKDRHPIKKVLSVILIGMILVAAGVFLWKKDELSQNAEADISTVSMVYDDATTDLIEAPEIEVTADSEGTIDLEAGLEGTRESEETEDQKAVTVANSDEETLDTENVEITQIQQVLALEVLGRYEEAADLCQEVLMGLDHIPEKEKLYEKAANLYLKTGNLEKACEVLAFGMEELLPSEYLWQCYQDLLTNDPNLEAEKKETMIEEFLTAHPEYKQEKDTEEKENEQ